MQLKLPSRLFSRPAGTGSRRLIIAGIVAGILPPAGNHLASLARRKKNRNRKRRRRRKQRCSFGCTTSPCGTVGAACPLFPDDHIWNARVDDLPSHSNSAAYIASIGEDTGLHADFGSGLYEGRPIGIPFVRVPANQPRVRVSFTSAGDESDPGPYPIPPDAPVEGGSCAGGDRHVLVVQEGSCLLHELYDARRRADGSWQAYSGAQFDLRDYALRPETWTSADAAGLAILPGLVRYEEIEAKEIRHALRFTASTTRDDYVWPARHQAGATSDPDVPPMGQRFRLKAEVDISGFSETNQIILLALKSYGMMLADNGSDWFLSGVPDDRWDNDDGRELRQRIHGRDFEAVDVTSLISDNPDSGQIAPA